MTAMIDREVMDSAEILDAERDAFCDSCVEALHAVAEADTILAKLQRIAASPAYVADEIDKARALLGFALSIR